MAVGLNFGKRAANLLEQGAATSTSAMAIGGAVVGGAYEGILGDGDMLGGAMMGAGLGTAAKFASNMYSIGAKSANSGSFKLSNFTDGYEQASRRNAVMGLGFNQRGASRGANRSNMNTGRANTSNPVGTAPSANATTSSTSSPYVPPTALAGASVENSAKQSEIFDRAKNLKTNNSIASQRASAADARVQRGSRVSDDARQRLRNSRNGDSTPGTYIPSTNRDSGSSFIGPLPTSNPRLEAKKANRGDMSSSPTPTVSVPTNSYGHSLESIESKRLDRQASRSFTDTTQASRDRIQDNLGLSQEIRANGYRPVYNQGKRVRREDGSFAFK